MSDQQDENTPQGVPKAECASTEAAPVSDVTNIFEALSKNQARTLAKSIGRHVELRKALPSARIDGRTLRFEGIAGEYSIYLLSERFEVTSDETETSVAKLAECARAFDGDVDEALLNSMIKMLDGMKPKGSLEFAQAVQCVVMHFALLRSADLLNGAQRRDWESVKIASNQLGKVSRATNSHFEAYRKTKNGNQQVVRVEHHHHDNRTQVAADTANVVVNSNPGVVGETKINESQPHGTNNNSERLAATVAATPEMWSEDAGGDAMPISSDAQRQV